MRSLLAVALASSLAGCDVLFQVDRVGGTVDGSAGDAFECIGYAEMIVGSRSRYRIITSRDDVYAQAAACRADRAHLAALDGPGEMEAIAARRPDPLVTQYWVGVVQAPNQIAPDVGWQLVTGEPVPAGMWLSGQPSDLDGTEDNTENVAGLDLADMRLRDHGPMMMHGAVCECDGKPEVAPP